MAAQQGWWKLDVNVELSATDRERIAEAIRKGFIEGQILSDVEESGYVEHAPLTVAGEVLDAEQRGPATCAVSPAAFPAARSW